MRNVMLFQQNCNNLKVALIKDTFYFNFMLNFPNGVHLRLSAVKY
jgi:hypothetical protein